MFIFIHLEMASSFPAATSRMTPDSHAHSPWPPRRTRRSRYLVVLAHDLDLSRLGRTPRRHTAALVPIVWLSISSMAAPLQFRDVDAWL